MIQAQTAPTFENSWGTSYIHRTSLLRNKSLATVSIIVQFPVQMERVFSLKPFNIPSIKPAEALDVNGIKSENVAVV